MPGLRPPERDIGAPRAPRWAGRALLALFALALLAFLLLDRLGISGVPAGAAVTGAALALFVAIAFVSAARRPVDFYLADRDIPAARAGLCAAAGLAGLLVAGIVGGSFATGAEIFAAIGGLLAGCVVALAGFASRLRRFGGYTTGDFLAARFGAAMRVAGGLVGFAASLLVVVAILSVAGPLVAIFLGTDPERGTSLAAMVAVLVVLPGGMRSLAAAQGVQYVLIAGGCLLPAAFLAWRASGDPIAVLAAPGLESLAPEWPSGAGWLAGLAVPAAMLAAGVAALPQTLAPALGARSPRGAVASFGWSVLLVLALLAATLILMQMLAVAGAMAGDLTDDFLDPGGPLLAAVPPVLAGLVMAAVLAALLAAAQSALYCAAAALAHDVWDEALDRRGPAGRRIVVARLLTVAIGWTAAAIVSGSPATAPSLLGWGLALSAAAGFMPLALGLWWRRCNASGALAGTLAGSAVAGLILLADLGLVTFGAALLGDATGSSLAASLGLATSFAVAVGVSLATSAPASRGVEGGARRQDADDPPLRERPA